MRERRRDVRRDRTRQTKKGRFSCVPMATTFLLLCAALVASVAGAEELKVTQYSGPTECDDADKVVAGKQLGMHYTGTIDKSSKTGVPGKKFDSSRDRGQPFDTQIGVGQVCCVNTGGCHIAPSCSHAHVYHRSSRAGMKAS